MDNKQPHRIGIGVMLGLRLSKEMVEKVDKIGERYGMNRQSVIRMALADLIRKENMNNGDKSD